MDPRFAELKQGLLDAGWETVTIEPDTSRPDYTLVTCERWSELAFQSFRAEQYVLAKRLQYISVYATISRDFGWRYAHEVSAWIDEHWKAPPVWVTQAELDAVAEQEG